MALLARNADNLSKVAQTLQSQLPPGAGPVHTFPTNTDNPKTLQKTFQEIRDHADLKNLKLKVAVWHVKHSSKKPFLEETPEEFNESISTYTTGAFTFAQEALKLVYESNGGESLLKDSNGEKKGTIIFTGTLGAMRTNTGYSAYGSGRAGVRMVAQALAKEVSEKGVHVVHAILNGAVRDEDSEETKFGQRMSAEAVGKTYLWLSQQDPSVWVHELDLRPALEKF